MEEINDNGRFADLVRFLRFSRRMTAKEMARQVGVSQPTVTQWEHGLRRPRNVGVVLRLLDVLDASNQEREEILASLGHEQPLSDHLTDEDLSVWVDGKLEKIVGLQSEITDQVGDLRWLLNRTLSLDGIIESAKSLQRASRYKEAAEAYEQACHRANKDNTDKNWLANLYIEAISPNYYLSQHDKCLSLAKKVISLFKVGDGNSQLISHAHLWLSAIYADFGDFKRAEQHTKRAMRLGSDHIDTSDSLGTIKAYVGEWREAERLFKDALECARSSPDVGLYHNSLAWLYIRQGRLFAAEDHCLESLYLRRDALKLVPSNKRGIAYCYSYLGEIHVELGHWSIAEAFLIAAIEGFSSIGDLRGTSAQYYWLALIALGHNHDAETALNKYAARFVEYFENSNFKMERAMGKRLTGMLKGQLDFDVDAQQLLQDSVEAFRLIGDKYELGLSCYELGRIEQKLGHQIKAEEYLMQAKTIFQNLYVPGRNRLEVRIKRVDEVLHSLETASVPQTSS